MGWSRLSGIAGAREFKKEDDKYDKSETDSDERKSQISKINQVEK